MFPLLITGITGVAGWNAFRYFRECYPDQVIGIRPLQTAQLYGHGIVGLASEDSDGMRDLFRKHRFAAVLNCVGNCALKSCELDPVMARRINVVSAEIITEIVREYGCRLVHLSSDLVFSGKGTGYYLETDATDPVTIYGKTMVEAELLFAAKVPRQRSCGFRCRWDRALISTPGRLTGSNHASGPAGPRRCTTMRCAHAFIATI